MQAATPRIREEAIEVEHAWICTPDAAATFIVTPAKLIHDSSVINLLGVAPKL